MNSNSDVQAGAAERSKGMKFAHAVIPFAVSTITGGAVSGVAALFVYANASDPHAYDTKFAAIFTVGLMISIAIGYIWARRAAEADPDRQSGSGLSLLKKYHQSAAPPGTDTQAGQYSIGEQYLRDLHGRRGA